jgi:His-Xaa-Ser system protein HxsD
MKDSKNKITILISPKLYSLESIYGASYVFLDKAYIFLQEAPRGKIGLVLRGKDKTNKEELKKIKDEFLNELLNFSLREKISKNNKKIREFIVAGAISSAIRETFQPREISEEEIVETKIPWKNRESAYGKEISKRQREDVWRKDPQGIAVPWEEKKSTK